MTIKELREKSPEELKQLLATEQETLRILRFKAAADELKNVREIRQRRHTIARIATLLHATKPRTSTHGI